HRSQSETLASFDVQRELFRTAPDHDFTRLPNGGALLYERYGWGLTGARWLDLTGAAFAELGLVGPP
ncbi:MAG: PIG-L family deacetylase, partial [Methylobacteriaceae bacterium]|nr:PIG-L family deacetylase [Methylobacteriaceae bacterium]